MMFADAKNIEADLIGQSHGLKQFLKMPRGFDRLSGFGSIVAATKLSMPISISVVLLLCNYSNYC
jgi:hypothetical protein